MNRVLFTAFLALSLHAANGQVNPSRGEFATNTNGLMYSDADMQILRFIVDSLNLRFKTCDLNKTYYSNPQARSYKISFSSESNDLKEIINDIKNDLSFHQLAAKYASFTHSTDSSSLIIRLQNDYYLSGTPGTGYDKITLTEDTSADLSKVKDGWTYTYSLKDKYSSSYRLSCYFFPEEWQRQAIPEQYSRLIQYVDCMIDTSAQVFLTDKWSAGWRQEGEKNPYFRLAELADHLDQKMNKRNNNSDLKTLSDKQIAFAVAELKNDAAFRKILGSTIDNYAKNKTPNHQLESLATQLGLYDKALLMKRCYRVMGMCSQDNSPREHARSIALLAAQAHSWDIFLRAHLDIMNDRFERVSDGSYAWGQRQTYLKELEELNLNIVDLMLGLTLRADNAADNHYYGTVWRLGWALTESREKHIFEQKAIAMMKDETLDEFNRGLIFLLYKAYLNHLEEKEMKQKKEELRQTAASFPAFIRASIREMNESAQRRR